MSKVAQMIWKSVGIGLTAVLLVTAVVWGYRMTPTDSPCVSLTYTIEDREDRLYLSEGELSRMLYSADLYPVGRTLNLISLQRIETAVRQHPMVRTAECYLTPRNEVRVRLTQRVPLLRVQTASETYLIDTDRRVMQARAAVRDSILLVTGTVPVQTAATTLADFAEWLNENRYWRERIQRLQMNSVSQVYVHLRGADRPRVLLGSMYGYERKLTKLRTFLDNSEEIIQDQPYTVLDIRFRGQVVGRK